jgi:hypothetical protein
MRNPSEDANETLRQRLVVERYSWGDEYCGTREELVAAAVVRQGMFPGDTGMGKTSYTHRGPPKISVRRKNKRQFDVTIHCEREERVRRYEIEQAHAELERAQADEAKDLDWLPESADDFRGRAITYLQETLRSRRSFIEILGAGYHFTAQAWKELDEAISDAIGDFAETPIHYKGAERRAFIAKVKQRTAKADPFYQSQMMAIVAAAAGQSPESEASHG